MLRELVIIGLCLLMGVVALAWAYSEGEAHGYRQALDDVEERDAELDASRRRVDQRLTLDEAERIVREDGNKWR